MRRWIANHPPVNLFKKIAALNEATIKVVREYRDMRDAQEQGGYESYACGIWIGGLKRGHADAVKAAMREKGGDPDDVIGPGWWDAVPPKRATYFFAMTTEAMTPMRAQLRCGEFLNNMLEEAALDGLVESVRIEVEPMSSWVIVK